MLIYINIHVFKKTTHLIGLPHRLVVVCVIAMVKYLHELSMEGRFLHKSIYTMYVMVNYVSAGNLRSTGTGISS